jgi:hypothetical protein
LPAKVAAISLDDSPERRKTTATKAKAAIVIANNITAPTPQNGLIVLLVAPSNATGNVVLPASLTNVEITALSRQSVNDKSAPAIKADEINGKVI